MSGRVAWLEDQLVEVFVEVFAYSVSLISKDVI